MPRVEEKRTTTRVAVPCCSCGRPTSMRVPQELLEEIDVLHLCTACVRSTSPIATGPREARRD